MTRTLLLLALVGIALAQAGVDHTVVCSSSGSLTINDDAGLFGCSTYTNQMTRGWLFTPASSDSTGDNERVLVQWDSFDTENGYDFVRVYDGESFAALVGSFPLSRS